MTAPKELNIVVLPTGPFETNCLLVHDGTEATVIDPGMGAATLVREAVAAAGVTVTRIVLTHGHIDHVRDLPEVQQEYGVPSYMSHDDLPWITREALDSMGELGRAHATGDMAEPEQPRPVVDGDTLDIAGVTFTAFHMPGHSPGSVMYRGEHGDGAVILGGDVLFRRGIGRTDLPLSAPHAMVASLQRIPEIFDDADTVFPGHGPTTTVGEERRENGFLQGLH